jgi:tRNA(Arg) A34 adenosine deaminase TadA
MTLTQTDEDFLRHAISLAVKAHVTGDAPYGSLLVGPDGAIVAEAHNTVVSDNDISAHPELKMARWAAGHLSRQDAARTTMYTSCQPCGMCTGAIQRSGLGRVVYALSTEQFLKLNPGGGWPDVPLDGPALFEEARVPIEEYYRR